MGKTKTIDNLKNIFIESYKWRNSDLSDSKSDKSEFRFFSELNIILFTISIGIILFINYFDNNDFDDLALNSILTFASIFATLIIPVLIMVYDKFSNNPNSHLDSVQQKSRAAQERIILYKNFTSRFIFTALENVFIAVVIITFIIAYKALLINFMDINPFHFNFQVNITGDGILIFIKIVIALLSKTIFLMLLLKFLLFLFYSIGALGDFFKDGLHKSS